VDAQSSQLAFVIELGLGESEKPLDFSQGQQVSHRQCRTRISVRKLIVLCDSFGKNCFFHYYDKLLKSLEQKGSARAFSLWREFSRVFESFSPEALAETDPALNGFDYIRVHLFLAGIRP
jgi:hypothetical protein